MKRKTVTIICIVLAAAMVLAIVGPVAVSGLYSLVASAASSDLNDKLNQNRQSQNELKQQLEETTREKQEIQEKKDKIDDEISVLAEKIDSINKTIAKNENDIAQKQEEITALEDNIEESYELLRKRLRSCAKEEHDNILKSCFGTSFQTFS